METKVIGTERNLRERVGVRDADNLTAMDLRTFNRLPLDEKTNYMWDNGDCLAQRLVEDRYILCIFEMNGFFVEAIYSKQNNRVNAILPVTGMDAWNAYVERVLRYTLEDS